MERNEKTINQEPQFTKLPFPEQTPYPSPPQQQLYQQPPPPPVTYSVITQPIIYSYSPQGVICPNCQSNVVTRIVKKNGTLPWIACGNLKDVEHYCPNCNRLLAVKRRV